MEWTGQAARMEKWETLKESVILMELNRIRVWVFVLYWTDSGKNPIVDFCEHDN
jgi:hypothetical protein